MTSVIERSCELRNDLGLYSSVMAIFHRQAGGMAMRAGIPPDLLSDGRDDSRGPEFSKAADQGPLRRLVAQETADRTAFDELVGDAAEHPFAQARMAVGA